MLLIKQLVLPIIFIINLALTAYGNDIAAIVGNELITNYELQMRKKTLAILNNVQSIDAATDRYLSDLALNSLIDDAVLRQNITEDKTTEQDIDNAIATLETRNKLPKDEILKILLSNNVDYNIFRAQIKTELIKMNIMSSVARSISVTPIETNAVILFNNSKDADIWANIFTSKDSSSTSFNKMNILKKQLKSCNNINSAWYSNFAEKNEVTQKLSLFQPELQSIIKDLEPHEASHIIKTSEGFKLILLCDKKISNINQEESEYVVNFLSNKKMSQKVQKFMDTLRKRSVIKIMK